MKAQVIKLNMMCIFRIFWGLGGRPSHAILCVPTQRLVSKISERNVVFLCARGLRCALYALKTYTDQYVPYTNYIATRNVAFPITLHMRWRLRDAMNGIIGT